MGVLHNELKEGDFGKAVENALGLDLAEGGLERVGETLQPTFNMWERPEWSHLRSERIWGVTASQPGVAGEFSMVGIAVPASSKLIAVVEQIIIFTNGVAATINVAMFSSVAFTASGTPNPRDSRIPFVGGATPTIGVTSFAHHQAALPYPAFIGQFTSAGNQEAKILPIEIVLTPGFALYVGPTVVNTAAAACLIGRSRPLRRGELGG